MTSKEQAYAKINLFLDLGELRPDGYHNLSSIMFDTTLSDRIIFSHSGVGQKLVTEYGPYYFEFSQSSELDDHQAAPDLELEHWSIVRALELYLAVCSKFDHKPEFSFNTLKLERMIPAQAGLGGASSDAAAVFRAINFEDPKIGSRLLEHLVSIGADVPFSYLGGMALATGRGEILESLPYKLANYPMLIVKPDIAVSTGQAFGLYDSAKLEGRSFLRSDIDGIMIALEKGELRKLRDIAHNTFVELLDMKSYELISGIISTLYEFDALYANMTGSGPACFAFFADEDQRDRAYVESKKRFGPHAWFSATHALN